jgi:hypothetical protein
LWWSSRQAAKHQAGLFGLGHSKARQYTNDQPRSRSPMSQALTRPKRNFKKRWTSYAILKSITH